MGTDTFFPNSNNSNFFLVKYDSNGVEQWARAAKIQAGSGNSSGVSVSVDGSGNCYVAGNLSNGTFTLGSLTIGPVVNNIAFLAKFNTLGQVDWIVRDVQLDSNIWRAMSVMSDSLKNIYLHVDCLSV